MARRPASALISGTYPPTGVAAPGLQHRGGLPAARFDPADLAPAEPNPPRATAWHELVQRIQHRIRAEVTDRSVRGPPSPPWWSPQPGIVHAEEAEEALVHGVGGFVDGHLPGFDLIFGGAAEGQAGGQ